MKKAIDYIGVGCGALVINEKNEVLLLKRTDKGSSGCDFMWTRPGGSIEVGETAEQALKREVLEEVGVDIELFGPMNFVDDIREEMHRVTCSCFARVISGELQNMEPEKHSQIAWFGLDELPENVADYTLRGIEEYKEYIKKEIA